jgi:DNA-binding NarL/FixJ family response regulator
VTGGAIRLAVVDDHAAVRESYAELLGERERIEVVGTACDGLEALELCRALEPDALVMDVRMPVLDGIEATRLIKRLLPRTRIVLVSAYEQRELVDSGREAGADLFVLKGGPGSELAAAVEELVWAG